MITNLPLTIRNEDELEELLSRPTDRLTAALAKLDGDIAILGVGGKMGPTLARMAKRAAPRKRVLGVARFSSPGLREKLESWDIETVACDLLNREAVSTLEKTANVMFMAGRKFGAEEDAPLTWAMNTYASALVAEAFCGSRISAFSTACVYPFSPITSGGAREKDALGPPGEYANSCVGRERIFEYFSTKLGVKTAILRLSYAIDMRYGVLHDIAQAVLTGAPIRLESGYCNVIWQGDANEIALHALTWADSPPRVLNVSGPERVSIGALAQAFGERFGKTPVLEGTEQDNAWLVDTTQQQAMYGIPNAPLALLIDWTADWAARDGRSLNKPTHFEVRDGAY